MRAASIFATWVASSPYKRHLAKILHSEVGFAAFERGKRKPRQAPSLRGLFAGVYPLRNGLLVFALLLLTGIAIIEA